jgi:glycosyltransferase involved in cell wall biosynthesis
MTCFNEADKVVDSLNSLMGQLNDDYEVVVVDNFSSDGTYEELRKFSRTGRLKAIQKRCTRGHGRQLAFENSNGKYVIANLDLDDVFLPVIQDLVRGYHRTAEGKLLAVFNSSEPERVAEDWVQNMTVVPRELVLSMGGWRDLNIYEDWDLWSRASTLNAYRWSTQKFAANQSVHPESRRWAGDRLARRYERYSNRLQLGLGIFSKGERRGISQWLAYVAARFTLPFKGVLSGQDSAFESFKPEYHIDLFSGADIEAREPA